MQEELLRLWDEAQFTVLFVTHSISEAIRVGRRILLLTPHPGQVRAELNSSGDDTADARGVRLSARVEELLFGSSLRAGEVAHE
jgi:NitT/TauT family transport system ATP-binding protein